MNLKKIDKQITELNKSATVLKRELNRLYRRHDNTFCDVRPLERQIAVLEKRAERITNIAQRFADDGFSFI